MTTPLERTVRRNWAVQAVVLGLGAAALFAFYVRAHLVEHERGLAALSDDLVAFVALVVLTVYALATTIAVRAFAHKRGAAFVVHGVGLAAAAAAVFAGSIYDRFAAARDEAAEVKAHPAEATLLRCLHVRGLEIARAPRRARVTVESTGCPPLRVRSMRVAWLDGQGLRLFGSTDAARDLAPGGAITLETDARDDGPSVDARTEWQVELHLAPPGPEGVAFRTEGVRRGSRLYGSVERVDVR
ncbi:MAG TPA: hypothetical protein VHB21_17125 [Minicystis sp.]|nr:hypothetical protein [Minicystis sp.]